MLSSSVQNSEGRGDGDSGDSFGQQNYRRCLCRHRLQSFATMKKTVESDQ
jgi:hypothetical protein